MLSDIWSFLRDESNRAVFAWAGGGIVVLAGGIWAVLKFFLERDKSEAGSKSEPPATPTVTASHGGVAAGHDIKGNEIKTGNGSKR